MGLGVGVRNYVGGLLINGGCKLKASERERGYVIKGKGRGSFRWAKWVNRKPTKKAVMVREVV